MYTECPSCQTYFKITPNQLKAAGGKVRCGNCEEVFSALDSLVDVVPDDVLSQLTSSAITEYSTAQQEALSLALSEAQITKDEEPVEENSGVDGFTKLLDSEIEVVEEIKDEDISITNVETSAEIAEETSEKASAEDEENQSLALASEINDTAPVEAETPKSAAVTRENAISNDIDEALDGLFDGNTEHVINDTAPVSNPSAVSPPEHSSISELEGLDFGGVGKEKTEISSSIESDKLSDIASEIESDSNKEQSELTSISQFEKELSATNTSAEIDESSFDLGDSFLDTEVDSGKSDKKSKIAEDSEVDEDSYVLEELAEPKSRSTGGIVKVLWILVILILLVVLLGQFAYHKRQDLVKYPSLKPIVEEMCKNLNKITACEISAAKDVAAIELLERNVVSHPNAKNALLITSTIENKAKFDQAFPQLILTFSDINQKIIAKRKFAPTEYLSKDVDIKAGMKMNVPIKLMLEIVDPGEEAVNFEFNFQ